MKIIIAKAEVAPENIEAFRELAKKQVEDSLKEPGCLGYECHELAGSSGDFIFIEKWRDREALSIHFKKDYSLDFIKKARAMTRKGATTAGMTIFEATEENFEDF